MEIWNGKVINGLVNRRSAEAKLFNTGVYTNDGKVQLIIVSPTDPRHRPRYTGTMVDIRGYL